MSHNTPRARDARGRFIARPAMVAQPAQQQQAQARPARAIASARLLTPGPAHLWHAAEGAIESGTPYPADDSRLIGYNAPGGVYAAAVYLLGPSAGHLAGRYRVEVCHVRAPYDARLCGTFINAQAACMHLGRLEVLAAYRAKRRAVLAGLAGVRRAYDRLDFGARVLRSAESIGVATARRDLAELRRYYGPTLAALSRVEWVPGPAPVRMVPQLMQQQQAQHTPGRVPSPHPMAPAIEAVSQAGFDVYMRADQGARLCGDTWLYFTDGKQIGYLQVAPFGGGYTLSTVHVPNRQVGAGFSLGDDVLSAAQLTPENLARAFMHAPAWGRHEHVTKWADWNAFAKRESWANYVKVAGPTL